MSGWSGARSRVM